MLELVIKGLKILGGMYSDFRKAAELKDEAELKAFVDKLEQTAAELTGRIRAQAPDDPEPDSGGS